MDYYNKEVELSVLVGKTINKIEGLKKESNEVKIFTTDGGEYVFYHEQDCCESVDLNDFELSADSLTGGLITLAEEVKGEIPEKTKDAWMDDSQTWTFYKIETDKGGLWMRWLGESNGYYSESVEFVWANKPD